MRMSTSTYRKILMCDPCSYCGNPTSEIDHIVAGGDNNWSNLTGACRRCNRRKRDVPLLFMLLGIGAPAFRSWPGKPPFPRREPKGITRDDVIEILHGSQHVYESTLAAVPTAARARNTTIWWAAREHGISIEEIAAELGVSFQLVNRIVNREPKGATSGS